MFLCKLFCRNFCAVLLCFACLRRYSSCHSFANSFASTFVNTSVHGTFRPDVFVLFQAFLFFSFECLSEYFSASSCKFQSGGVTTDRCWGSAGSFTIFTMRVCIYKKGRFEFSLGDYKLDKKKIFAYFCAYLCVSVQTFLQKFLCKLFLLCIVPLEILFLSNKAELWV